MSVFSRWSATMHVQSLFCRDGGACWYLWRHPMQGMQSVHQCPSVTRLTRTVAYFSITGVSQTFRPHIPRRKAGQLSPGRTRHFNARDATRVPSVGRLPAYARRARRRSTLAMTNSSRPARHDEVMTERHQAKDLLVAFGVVRWTMQSRPPMSPTIDQSCAKRHPIHVDSPRGTRPTWRGPNAQSAIVHRYVTCDIASPNGSAGNDTYTGAHTTTKRTECAGDLKQVR